MNIFERQLWNALFLVMWGITAGSAFGAEPPYEMQEMVVTASRVPVSRDKIGSAVTVVTREEIREKKIRYLKDVFRQTVSMDVFSFGGQGSQTQVLLRGADASQTLILVDGVRIGSNLASFATMPNLATENVERIEIVRGNQSTLYGSSAIGGVVNVITKRGGDRNEAYLTTEVGSWQTKRASGGISGIRGKLKYNFSGYYSYSGGYSIADEYTNPGGLEDDISSSKDFSAAFSYPLTNFDVDMSVNYSDGVTASDANTTDSWGLYSWLDQLSSNIRVSRAVSDRYDYQINLGYSFEKTDNKFFPAPGSSNNLHRLSYTRTADFQNNYRAGEHTLTFGWAGELFNGRDVRRANPYGQRIYQRSMYAQDLFDWKNWTLTLGGRTDHIEDDSGSAYLATKVARTFRATGSRHLTENTRFHASYGTGFKKPTIFNLLFPGTSGNTRLKPEKTRGWDAGIDYHSKDGTFQVDVTYFLTEFRDLIVQQVAGGQSVGPNLNAGSAGNHGFEISGRYDLTSKLSMSFDATFQQSNIRDTFFQVQPEFTRRPDKKAGGTIRYEVNDKFDMLSQIRFYGKAWNVNTNNTEVLSQATITDFIFNYEPDPHTDISFRVNNAFDQVKYDVPGFSPAMRSTWLTYTWKL